MPVVAPVKVSVVVPVYNPGEHIEALIESLRRQSLRTEEFEAVFVDDGSTDATPARLDTLAAEEPNVHVVHQPNSGWPGKPRNVGIDASRGEFVQFVDQDDELGDEALDRLYRRAVETSSDVVLGKVVGRGRSVPVSVYRRRDDHATLKHSPLVSTLSPHKLFRKRMLDERGIRFPEGRRRLEDHPFVLTCYFAARNIAILADYPCYYFNRRGDDENNSFKRFDPAGYYRDVEDGIDVIEVNTEPGRLRNKLLSRFYRNEMLGRLREPKITRWPEDYRKELFEQIRQLGTRRFPDDVPDGMPLPNRLRSLLLREGRLDDMVEFARRCDDVRARADLVDIRWRDGRLELDVTAAMAHADGTRVTWIPDGEGYRFDPRLTDALFRDEDRGLDSAKQVLGQVTAYLTLRNRATGAEWPVPAKVTKWLAPLDADDGAVTSTVTVVASMDLSRLLVGAPLTEGRWDFLLHLSFGGLVRKARVGTTNPDAFRLVDGPVAADSDLRAEPYFTGTHDKLSLIVQPVHPRLSRSWLEVPPAEPSDGLLPVRIGSPRARKAVYVMGTLADTALDGLPISADRATRYSRALHQAARRLIC